MSGCLLASGAGLLMFYSSMPSPGLYIHIPFCQKKCPFCSFAVVIGQERRVDEYLMQLSREAECYRGTDISTVYIGGGTPSLLSVGQIQRLFSIVRSNFRSEEDAETTFECNPENLTEEKACALKELGVNRVSLGVQSMQPHFLKWLGRSHHVEDSDWAFKFLRSAGLRNISLDLIYGLPEQTAQELERDLDGVLAFGSEHLSVYSLSVEERSLFFARKVQAREAADPDWYSVVCRRAESAGLRQYEISNFAHQGRESRHNLNYWEGGDYIGLGMAAHSHLQGERFWNADTFPQYLQMMEEKRNAVVGREKLAPHAKLVETFLFGLRMNKGVDLSQLERRFGCEMAADKKEMLENLIETGLLEEKGPRILTTARGRVVLDEISANLI
jgi:oxygen-independent coproporphyrinogen III oxidase